MAPALPQQCPATRGTIAIAAHWSCVRAFRDEMRSNAEVLMIVKKTILSLAAAGALALAGTAAAPQPANAVVWWVAPAIIGGAIVGTAAGASIAHQNDALAYEPQGAVYVQPTAGCHWARVQTASGAWVRERVCP
jgi:hypothetical protein